MRTDHVPMYQEEPASAVVSQPEELGHFPSALAHDFNNLLTAILGNLSLVLASLPRGDPNRKLLEEAENASIRASELIRQMLSASRKSPLRRQR